MVVVAASEHGVIIIVVQIKHSQAVEEVDETSEDVHLCGDQQVLVHVHQQDEVLLDLSVHVVDQMVNGVA